MTRPDIAAAILARVAASRGSICPSEVARGLAPEAWRPLMSLVREAAAGMAREGRLTILRKGRPIAPEAMHGVIRLRRAGVDEEEAE